MANPYSLKIKSIATDGTNLYVEIGVTSGQATMPSICPVFSVGTSSDSILEYCQNIVDSQPSLTSDIAALVGQTVIGA